jgi:rifampicin phosphotransferase
VERAARARERILEATFPEELTEQLSLWCEERLRQVPAGLVVHASATCEDETVAELANLSWCYLGIQTQAELFDSIRKIWSLAFLPSSLEELVNKGIKDVQMAVLFQDVLSADVSGTLYTQPPRWAQTSNWQQGERVINARKGLSRPRISLNQDQDLLRFSSQGQPISSLIPPKTTEVLATDRGVQEQAIPIEMREQSSLRPEQLEQVLNLAQNVDRVFHNQPMLVEFAFSENEIQLLDCKALSGRGFPMGGESSTVWSRAAVSETLPDVPTPLSWSLLKAFSESAFQQTFKKLGCSVPKGTQLLSRVHGRPYVNVSALNQIAAQIPKLNPHTLMAFGGSEHREVLGQQTVEVSRRTFYTHLPFTVSKLLREQRKMTVEVDRFERTMTEQFRFNTELDLGILPDDSLGKSLHDARLQLDRTLSILLSSTSAYFLTHWTLRSLLARKFPLQAEALAQTLSAGTRGLQNAQVAIALGRIVSVVRSDKKGHQELQDPAILSLEQMSDGPSRSALRTFLRIHGDNCVREGELSHPRWREQPAQLFRLVGTIANNPELDPEKYVARARALADAELARLEGQMSSIELELVRVLIERTQRFCMLRDRVRAWVTKCLSHLRDVALEIDRRLLRIDPKLEPGAVFFCTFGELLRALATGRPDVRSTALLRQTSYLTLCKQRPPPVTFVGIPVNATLPPNGTHLLLGVPASGGTVSGRVRLITDDSEAFSSPIAPDEIVVLRSPSVGFTPLLLTCSAVVAELGSPLSHPSLIARELGVPMVVGVARATLVLRTGDWVRVDGKLGSVEKIATPPT